MRPVWLSRIDEVTVVGDFLVIVKHRRPYPDEFQWEVLRHGSLWSRPLAEGKCPTCVGAKSSATKAARRLMAEKQEVES